MVIWACKPNDPSPIVLENVAFVVSGESRTVEVIDLLKQEVIKSYSVSNQSNRFPHHIYLSSDNALLAIANPTLVQRAFVSPSLFTYSPVLAIRSWVIAILYFL